MQFFPARHIAGIFIVVFLFFSIFRGQIFAQGQQINQATPTPTASSGNWVQDDEVTFVGKAAVRAENFLDWTLNPKNAQWVFLNPDTSINQIAEFWSLIRNIAYVLTLLIVLFTAFLIIITRGQSINARKQIITVGAILVLITFSFAIIDFLYRIIDTLQGFFLRLPNPINPDGISSKDLLYVGFDYKFLGYRLKEAINEEAANVALFLVKATTVTYYVMAAVLLIRKIILWFFIILSPVWVLLLPFPLVRNTAKIWMGEFFRWLFYGPLFVILLAGLVKMWQLDIPLKFDTVTQVEPVYPTAISILLGGPGVTVSLDNSVNNIDTYAKYVVALIMLWVVIILPFVLLRIFRDVFASIFKEDNAFFQKAFGAIYPFLGRPPPPSPQPSPIVPPGGGGEGRAQEMALHKPIDTGLAREITIQAQVANIEALPQVKTTDIVKYAGLSVPNIRDLARMEMQKTSLLQNQMLLRNIAAPTSITSLHERSRFSSIQQELLTRAKKGDVQATTILAAAESARTGQPVPIVVGARPAVAKAGAPVATKPQLMPTVNRIQTVNIDDYEEVKKMWEENYRSGDVPISDKVKSRQEWIKQDLGKIESVIELLSNVNEEKKKEGIEQLVAVLPFLLLGGFSDQETIVYLKAKLEAAKKVLVELEQKTKEEEEKVLVEEKKEETEEKKEMEANVPLAEEKADKPVSLKEKIEGNPPKESGEDKPS